MVTRLIRILEDKIKAALNGLLYTVKSYNNKVWIVDMAIVQMQDFLDLDSSCRMNTPSTVGNNLKWRLKNGVLNSELTQRIEILVKLYGR